METESIKCESPHHIDGSLALLFCSKCKQLLCYECILDYHLDHSDEAPMKIEEIICNEKIFYEKILVKTKDSEISRRVDFAQISRYYDKLEQTYNTKVKEVEQVIKNLKNVLETERILYETVKSLLEKQVNKCFKSSKYENILEEKKALEKTVNEWEFKSRSEILRLYKNRSIIEGNVNLAADELLKEPNYIDEFNKVMDLYNKKTHFEEINKIELLTSNIKIKIETFSGVIESNEDINIIFDKLEFKKNRKNKNRNSNISIPPQIDVTNFKFLIHYHWLRKEINFTDLLADTTKVNVIKLKNSYFPYYLDTKAFENLSKPMASRYINIGESILFTGGIIDSKPRPECYLMNVIKEENNYKVNVKIYTKMSESRMNHSMIYLEDIESVLVCGGSNLSSAELTSITQGTWRSLNPMSEPRQFATLLYLNKKTVFCFRGQPDDNEYSDTCESIEIKNPTAKWNYIRIENISGLNLKFSFSGLIQLNRSKFLLVGGGFTNSSKDFVSIYNVLEILIEDNLNWIISNNRKIESRIVFYNQDSFINLGAKYLNFDSSFTKVEYNTLKNALNIV